MIPMMPPQALDFHPAPAAPAPAPSQIRFPRLPGKNPFSGFPGTSMPKAEMVFLSGELEPANMGSTPHLRQENPTRLH